MMRVSPSKSFTRSTGFARPGIEPVVAATEKKRLNAVIHDFYPGWNTYIEKPGYLIESDITFDDVVRRQLRGRADDRRTCARISPARRQLINS